MKRIMKRIKQWEWEVVNKFCRCIMGLTNFLGYIFLYLSLFYFLFFFSKNEYPEAQINKLPILVNIVCIYTYIYANIPYVI